MFEDRVGDNAEIVIESYTPGTTDFKTSLAKLKDVDAIVFLDCVAEDFIQIGKNIRGLEKAVRYTQKGRSLGLGTLGFHTYLQQNMIAFESSS
jgi:hypothetical protein